MVNPTMPWMPNQVRFQSYLPSFRMEAGAGENEEPDTNANTGGDPAGTPPATNTKPTPKHTDEDVERIVKARVDRLNKQRETETAKAAEEAETKRLAEQKEFAKLAAQFEGQVKKLEPELESTKAERDALREYVTTEIEERTKDWPASLKALIPTEGTATARLAAYNSAKAVYVELKGEQENQETAPRRNPGNTPRTPRPAGNNQTPAEAEINHKRASGRYTL